MLPGILMSLRHGPKWGLFTALCAQPHPAVLGLKTSPTARRWAQIGCVLLDYVLAFTVLGLAWYIAQPFPSSKG